MKINLISVGEMKENFFVEAKKEYLKRISRFAVVSETVLKDEPIPAMASLKEEEEVMNIEGKKIIKVLPKKSYIIALDRQGKTLSSLEFAGKIDEVYSFNCDSITFIIGGSLGLSQEVLNLSDYKLSFSAMTFPHQLMKVILLEQIYRSFKINNNEKYHK